jgi:hypothetical protein
MLNTWVSLTFVLNINSDHVQPLSMVKKSNKMKIFESKTLIQHPKSNIRWVIIFCWALFKNLFSYTYELNEILHKLTLFLGRNTCLNYVKKLTIIPVCSEALHRHHQRLLNLQNWFPLMDYKISMITRWNRRVHKEHNLKQRTRLYFCLKCIVTSILKGTGAWEGFATV